VERRRTRRRAPKGARLHEGIDLRVLPADTARGKCLS